MKNQQLSKRHLSYTKICLFLWFWKSQRQLVGGSWLMTFIQLTKANVCNFFQSVELK